MTARLILRHSLFVSCLSLLVACHTDDEPPQLAAKQIQSAAAEQNSNADTNNTDTPSSNSDKKSDLGTIVVNHEFNGSSSPDNTANSNADTLNNPSDTVAPNEASNSGTTANTLQAASEAADNDQAGEQTSPDEHADTSSAPPGIDNTANDKIDGKVAIIIDDMGYNRRNGMRALNLPGAMTYAVLPFTPHAVNLAEEAHRRQKEIMLHAPMSSIQGTPLDPGALTGDMDRATFEQNLQQSLDAVPHIRGLNNHMGSRLTQNSQAMDWLMTELKQRQLYFIDSRTSPASVAWDAARQAGIATNKRDVFLDHSRDPAAIERQFQRLLRIARRTGQAIAIGHPYPETLALLEQHLPTLSQQGIALVSISALTDNLTSKPAALIEAKVAKTSLISVNK